MRQFIFRILGIFIVGVIGGIFGAQILWPLLVERPLFYKYRLSQTPTYVTETKQIVVQENTALQDAMERVKKTVIAVRSRDLGGQIRRGSGLVLTSDGLTLTLNELLPQGGEFVFLAAGQEKPARYQVLKRDPTNNLALIKLELEGLSTLAFADISKLKLGERVFLVSALAEPQVGGVFTRVLGLNEGVVSSLAEDLIGTTMSDDFTVRGAPVFNITGDIVGLSDVAADGRVTVIPGTILRSFTGL